MGSKYVVIENIVEKNSHNKTKYNRVKIIDVPQTEMSIRTLVNLGSVGPGQGYKRCNCTQGCQTARCKCFRGKFLCNSACHCIVFQVIFVN